MALSFFVSIRYPAEEIGGIRMLECFATLIGLHPTLYVSLCMCANVQCDVIMMYRNRKVRLTPAHREGAVEDRMSGLASW